MEQKKSKRPTNLQQCLSEEISACLAGEEELYADLKNYSREHGLVQTEKLLDYCRTLHKGQYRKGKEKIPYIVHPFMLARHAISLGRDSDVILSVCLLHDVCEDCGIDPKDLPVDEETREAVALLTKKEDFAEEDNDAYYEAISQNRVAALVKVLDRCNNVSGMAAAFSDEKLARYIIETREHTLVLLEKAQERFPEDQEIYFALSYHIRAVILSIQFMLKREKQL